MVIAGFALKPHHVMRTSSVRVWELPPWLGEAMPKGGLLGEKRF